MYYRETSDVLKGRPFLSWTQIKQLFTAIENFPLHKNKITFWLFLVRFGKVAGISDGVFCSLESDKISKAAIFS